MRGTIDVDTDRARGTEPEDSARRDELARQWVAGVHRGDAAALESVYRAWFDPMVRSVQQWTQRDEAFAMDVVQDAMVRFIDKTPSVRGEQHLRAWLWKASASAAIDRIRREGRARLRECTASGASHPPEVQESLERSEMQDGVDRLLAELSALERELVRERVGRGRELSGVGEEAGMTVGAVHGKVRRILTGLQNRAREMFR